MNFFCFHKPLGDLEFEPHWRGGRNRMGEEEGEEEEGLNTHENFIFENEI